MLHSTHGMVILLGLLTFSGCAMTPPLPAPNPIALASPQYATVQAAHEATKKRDWPAFVGANLSRQEIVDLAMPWHRGDSFILTFA